MNVLVTGASGVLGSAIYNAFRAAPSNFQVKGTAHTRPSENIEAIDLCNKEAVSDLIHKFKPDWVIHCAAERRPDVAAKNPEAARELNGVVPATLAQLSVEHGFTLIYISTDYVFDGTSPPYGVDAKPNPLNLYGETKLAGELFAYQYGPAPNNSDSAINILVDIVKDQSGKTYTMDHYATRYPTNVLDIADFLVRLSAIKKPLPPILHYSGLEPYTKYEICLIMAKILNLPHVHIKPDAEAPPPSQAASRPKNCQLSLDVLETLGVDIGGRDFVTWWQEYLSS
ncbi:hypothetical protein RhiLY_03981 [Ceratobasidium sp. AG-Ba]|nr:hypothetical protein RhiLY_03981 [Ceratobasidium sp. AG-Ba]